MGIGQPVNSPAKDKPVGRKETTVTNTSFEETTGTNSKEVVEENKIISQEKIIDDGSELSLEKIHEEWPKVMQGIKTKKINIYALLLEGEVVNYMNNLLTIGYKEGFGFHKDAISSPNNKEFVEELVSAHFKKPISMTFIMGNKATKSAPVADKTKEDAIKNVVDFFGEDIVEII